MSVRLDKQISNLATSTYIAKEVKYDINMESTIEALKIRLLCTN